MATTVASRALAKNQNASSALLATIAQVVIVILEMQIPVPSAQLANSARSAKRTIPVLIFMTSVMMKITSARSDTTARRAVNIPHRAQLARLEKRKASPMPVDAWIAQRLTTAMRSA